MFLTGDCHINKLRLFLFSRIAQSHIIEDERVNVGLFLEDFCEGLATTMTSLGVDADQYGIAAFVTLLQGGCKLKRVGWYHTVVVVGGGDHDGGIMHIFTALDSE